MRLQKSETQRSELEALEQSLKDQVDQLKIDSESSLRTKEEELEQLKKEMKRETENAQLKI